MQRRDFILTLICLPILSVARPSILTREPVVGLPCEGCEAVFVGIPKMLSSQARIAPVDEPGEQMHLTGSVVDRNGSPKPGVIIYAYQTDAKGIYPTPAPRVSGSAGRHGRLRAWVKTGADGRYRFDTIRPASYPNSNIPQHIHMHVIEPGRATYYIDDVMFTDDLLLTSLKKKALVKGRGGSGIVTPEHRNGAWWVRRDITLGLEIPGYPRADAL